MQKYIYYIQYMWHKELVSSIKISRVFSKSMSILSKRLRLLCKKTKSLKSSFLQCFLIKCIHFFCRLTLKYYYTYVRFHFQFSSLNFIRSIKKNKLYQIFHFFKSLAVDFFQCCDWNLEYYIWIRHTFGEE